MMPIIYRQTKGAPLLVEEIDGNFAELEQRLKTLETTPILAEGIGKITQAGDHITITGSFGTVFGTFTLPKSLPNPRGEWLTRTAYAMGDWVAVKNQIYACVRAHTSGVFATDLESGIWKVLLTMA
jgi:hypothetical protein